MSTSLANPRRTRLSTLPGQGSENPDRERQVTTPAESGSDDQGDGA